MTRQTFPNRHVHTAPQSKTVEIHGMSLLLSNNFVTDKVQ